MEIEKLCRATKKKMEEWDLIKPLELTQNSDRSVILQKYNIVLLFLKKRISVKF